jgi:hypothetical protein
VPPPPAPPPRGDRATLYGVLGIVLGICCCGILGLVLGWLSAKEAKRVGKPPTLGYVAMVIGAIALIWHVFAGVRYASGDMRLRY